MKKPIAFVVMSALALTFLASCGDDNKSSELSSDCAINAIVLGNLSRIYHTYLDNGKDTSYSITVPGAAYPLHIDQINRRIFNSDSLPVGTAVNKVYFTTFSADGIVSYRLESGKDTLYSTKDTLDFTSPRIFTIFASDGSGSRSYTIDIKIHNADPDAYSWVAASPADNDVAKLESMRMIAKDGQLYLWGSKNGTNVVMTRKTGEGVALWTKKDISGTDGLQTKSINLFNGKFVAISESGLVESENGADWTETATSLVPDRILAADEELYITVSGKIYSSSDLKSWKEEKADNSTAFLPTENIYSAVLPAVNNPNIENIVCVGYLDGKTETWKKEMNKVYPEDNTWSYYPTTEETPRTLPYLKGFNMMKYDGKLFCAGINGDTVNVYTSTDGARAWKKVKVPTMVPAPTGKPTEIFMTPDDDNHIWLVCSGTGTLWKGYLNRLKADKSE